MKLLKYVATAALALSLMGVSAYARGGGHGPGGEGGRGGDHIGILLNQLTLTTDQITTLQTLATTFAAERETLESSETSKSATLASAISADGLDTELLIATETATFQEHINLEASHLEQIIAVLTSDQRTELKALLEAQATTTSTQSLESLGY